MNQNRRSITEEEEAANTGSHSGTEAGMNEPSAQTRVRSSSPARLRLKILLGFAAVLAAIIALVWWLSLKPKTNQMTVTSATETSPAAVPPVAEPTLQLPSPQPSVESSIAPPESSAQTEPTPQPTASPLPSPSTVVPSDATSLLVPVSGVRPDQLRDTFRDARSEGRVHDAIDIPAPRGTPVLAATDGRIVKLFQSVPGGTTIYQLGTDNKTIYYYAHLDRYAEGLREDSVVHRGDVIAYVGDTGNAGAGNYHLHFSVSIVSDPKRYWQGTNINPYPLLRGTQK